VTRNIEKDAVVNFIFLMLVLENFGSLIRASVVGIASRLS